LIPNNNKKYTIDPTISSSSAVGGGGHSDAFHILQQLPNDTKIRSNDIDLVRNII
jgi:hypothetical protein